MSLLPKRPSGPKTIVISVTLVALVAAQNTPAQLLIPTSGGATISFANGNDDGSSQRSLGMTGTFYGTTYTDVYINTNGSLNFNPFNGHSNSSLLFSPPPGIYSLWDDLSIDDSASVIENKLDGNYYAVTWNNLHQYLDTSTRHTFQATWFGANSTINSFGFRPADIALSYASLGDTFYNDTATVGIVSPTYDEGVGYYLHTSLPGGDDGNVSRSLASLLLPVDTGFLLYRPNADGTSYSAARVETGSNFTRLAAGTLPVVGGVYTQAGSDLVIGGDSNPLFLLSHASVNGLQNSYIGSLEGTSGRATLENNSQWVVTSILSVGYHGTGTLNISTDSDVAAAYGSIGTFADAHGSVTVAGNGSTYSNNFEFLVGEEGQGSLNLESGGQVLLSSYGIIGDEITASGVVSVAGQSSKLTAAADLTVGWRGHGQMSILDGGAVENASGTIGYWNDSGLISSVRVSGTSSTWTNKDSLTVGNLGKGSLLIENGGEVTSDRVAPHIFAGSIADGVNSVGTAIVTGVDSTWTNYGDLYIGRRGTGEIHVTDGATVSSTISYLGYNGGSTGTALISGAGSTWASSSDLFVGLEGHGYLTIDQGAQVTSLAGLIGSNGPASTVTVAGVGSKWTNTSNLVVGTYGAATLNILNGGQVSNTLGYIGYENSLDNYVAVDGVGSKWINSGELQVGRAGKGELAITGGGLVTNEGGSIAFDAGSVGIVTVTGAGSEWTNSGSMYIGGSTNTSGGVGNLRVTAGGTAAVGATLKLWNSGTLTLDGGTVKTQHLNANVGALNWISGTLHTTGNTTLSSTLVVDGSSTYVNDGSIVAAVNVASGGLVKGSGNFGHLTVADGGAVSPGISTGTLTAEHTVWSSGGKYSWEINRLASQGGTAGGANGWDGWDLGDFAGSFTPGTHFNLELQSLDSQNKAGALANWSPSQAYSWLIATADDFAAITPLLPFIQIDASLFAAANNLAGGSFSVEALEGQLDGGQLWLKFTPSELLVGDYNADGLVNAADYTVWRDHYGQAAGSLPNDPTGLAVGSEQYTVWKNNYGAAINSSRSLSAIPEPGPFALFSIGMVSVVHRRRR